jgi:glycosyltransferase involved in cell wall biosynthesis
MKILIYWEQESWGGVDSHLLSLLSSWPTSDDHFIVMINKGNFGFLRIKNELLSIPNVSCREIESFSINQINYRLRQIPYIGKWIAKLVVILNPIIFPLTVLSFYRHLKPFKKFDIFVGNNGAYPGAWGALSALIASKLLGIPVRALLVHHAASHLSQLWTGFEVMVDKTINKVADVIICVSYATKKTLLERRRINDELVRVRVIHNGVPKSKIKDVDYGGIRRMVDLGPDQLLLGILGRVTPYKGHEDLLFALARLPEAYKIQIKVIIIGGTEGDYAGRLKRLAINLGVESQVFFAGYIPGNSNELVAQLDLVLMLTRSFEGFGLTLAEAIRSGVPVLSTRVGAVEEFVAKENGEIINPCSPSEIADALISFIDDHLNWKKKADSVACVDAFSCEFMAAEYRQLFTELIIAIRESEVE